MWGRGEIVNGSFNKGEFRGRKIFTASAKTSKTESDDDKNNEKRNYASGQNEISVVYRKLDLLLIGSLH